MAEDRRSGLALLFVHGSILALQSYATGITTSLSVSTAYFRGGGSASIWGAYGPSQNSISA